MSTAGTRRHPLRSLGAWAWRYLPSELACTAAMLAVGTLVLHLTGSAAIAALPATLAGTVGFYSVAGSRIYLEQRRLVGGGRLRLLRRTAALAALEFGPMQLLDMLLVRPVLLGLGVVLAPDPALGLLAGKLAADLVFYVGAALLFSASDAAGLRRSGRATPGETGRPADADVSGWRATAPFSA